MTETLVSNKKALDLPPGWTATELAGRAIELRVSGASQRLYVVGGAATLAAIASWQTLVRWGNPGGSTPWLVATFLLTLFALWCAFAAELWHIERNCLVHQVGIGSWAYRRRYVDAQLQIVLGRSTNFNVPYYRLYALMGGRSYFLFERGETELRQLANLISFHTGWRILAGNF